MVVDEAHIQQYHHNLNGNNMKSNNSKSLNINLKLDPHHNDHTNSLLNTIEMDYAKIGRTIKSALLQAQSESRLIVGLRSAIQVLSKSPEGTLFCLMAVPQNGDAATHMHEVLLEAFCYENDIYVIKVDSPTKLSRILGKTEIETCVLVQKPWTSCGAGENNEINSEELLNKQETMLVDYCEAFWDAPKHPIVELP